MLPTWLSPTQVRIIPVSGKYLNDSIKLMEYLEGNRIRVDVDDREESVEKRIMEAETEWIPYIVVFGRREKESGKLSVRIRAEGRVAEMEAEELVKRICEEVRGKPFKPLPLPKLLSRRPIFS